MSLINDALTRAREAQNQAPPAPNRDLKLQPVEPTSRPNRKPSWLVPLALTAAALIGVFCIYHATRPGGSEISAQARIQTPAEPPAPSQAAASSETKDPGSPNVAATSPATTEIASTKSAAPALPDQLGQTDTTLPKPAPPRLQAIVFNPTRPSAMIGGRTVFVGDKLGDQRVVAIGQDSVTLAGPGQTNLLTLNQ